MIPAQPWEEQETLRTTSHPAASSPPDFQQAQLTVGGNLISTGTLQIEIDGPANDLLAIGGNLDISNTTLEIITLSGGFTKSAYTIATYDTLNGTFASTSGIPTGYQIKYNHDNGTSIKNIALISTTGEIPSAHNGQWILY